MGGDPPAHGGGYCALDLASGGGGGVGQRRLVQGRPEKRFWVQGRPKNAFGWLDFSPDHVHLMSTATMMDGIVVFFLRGNFGWTCMLFVFDVVTRVRRTLYRYVLPGASEWVDDILSGCLTVARGRATQTQWAVSCGSCWVMKPRSRRREVRQSSLQSAASM